MGKYFYYYLFVGSLLLLNLIALPLFISPNSIGTSAFEYDSIIVLGGGLSRHCTLDASLKARMETAIDWYQQKGVPLILTGGPQKGNCLEAESMRQFALSKQVADTDLLKENQALNTYQNAYFAVELMQKKGLKKALIVTSDFHVKRASLIFQEYNIEYRTIPAINKAEGAAYYQQLLKEQLLLCFHQIFGVPDRFGLDVKDKKLYAVLKSLAAL